jgi:alpha-beta hydrolase superfamily lysophospholipase
MLHTIRWPAATPRAHVIVAHGFGEHIGRYARLGQAFAQTGLDAVGFDARGHGRSDGVRGDAPSYGAYVEDLRGLVGQVRTENPGLPLFLFGHSFGGALVLHTALHCAPGELAGVVATGPYLKLAFTPPAWKVSIGRALGSIYPGLRLPTELQTQWLSRDAQVARDYRADPLAHSTISARVFFGIEAANAWTLEHAGELTVPLLVMHGGDDHITDAATSERFVARAGSADKTYRLLPGMYHEVLNEIDAGPVYDEILAWLRQRS